jgi:NAD(P)-dependent dehydrogenase (short-subunit alcohol dehydrogenase family)
MIGGAEDVARGLLRGKRALITGGGNGMGQASAMLFADHGAAVGVLDLRADLAEEVAASIRAAGGSAVAVQADVTNEQDVQRAVAAVADALGGLNLLVNCAGVTNRLVPLEAMSLDRWDQTMSVNLRSQVLMCRAAFPWLAREGGAVINIASSAGVTSYPFAADYATSKAGVIMLTRQLASEWGPHGIRVNAISPGSIDTGFGRGEGRNRPALDPALRARRERSVPLGRLGQAEDVARVVLFLASSLAGYVSGANIMVDGGQMQMLVSATSEEVGTTQR